MGWKGDGKGKETGKRRGRGRECRERGMGEGTGRGKVRGRVPVVIRGELKGPGPRELIAWTRNQSFCPEVTL